MIRIICDSEHFNHFQIRDGISPIESIEFNFSVYILGNEWFFYSPHSAYLHAEKTKKESESFFKRLKKMENEKSGGHTADIYTYTSLNVFGALSYNDNFNFQITTCSATRRRSEQMEYILKTLFVTFQEYLVQEDVVFFIKILRQIKAENIEDLERHAKKIQDYYLTKLIGKGLLTEVYQADVMSNNIYAIKLFRGPGLNKYACQCIEQDFSNIRELLKSLGHENLHIPYNCCIDNCQPFLVMYFFRRGSATQLIGKISESEAWKFLYDVASGLAFLHSQKPMIIHQNIKLNNVLIGDNGRYIVSDPMIFNSAKKYYETVVVSEKFQTSQYPPESVETRNSPIRASDMWSLGAVLFELLTGYPPFEGPMSGLLQKHGAEIPEITGNWSNELKSIVLRCLQINPWDRPTASDIIKYVNDHKMITKTNS